MSLLTISTLGDYTKYRCVFYRVYTPTWGQLSGRGREPHVVVTNLGPLAITAANLYSGCRETYSGQGFLLGFITPITLTTIIASKTSYSIEDLLKNPQQLSYSIIKGLSDTTKKCIETYTSLAEEKCCKDSERDGEKTLLTYLELLSTQDIGGQSRHAGNNSGEQLGSHLPLESKSYEAKIVVGEYEEGTREVKDRVEFNGWIKLVFAPLTGSFPLGQGAVIFREASRNDIEVFGEALDASYIKSIKYITDEFLAKLKENRGDKDIALIVDTTHGLNIATTAMVRVLEDTLPLIRYGILSQEPSLYGSKIMYYNSDPALRVGKNDKEALERTRRNNISYYYTLRTPRTMSQVIERIEDLVLKEAKNTEDSLLKVLQGVCLLRHGLIPWGFYNISIHGGRVEDTEDYIIEVEVQPRDNIINVKYRCPQRGGLKEERIYVKMLGLWLAQLSKEAVNRLSKDLEVEIKGIDECWNGVIEQYRIRCYSLEKLRNLFEDKEDDNWAKLFLGELVEETARLILLHEINQWLNQPLQKLQYQVPPLFKLREDHKNKCSETLRGTSIDEHYCITPMKTQEEARNIIAHAGLTSAHKAVAFIFKDNEAEEKTKCIPEAICIAKEFPFEKLAETLKET